MSHASPALEGRTRPTGTFVTIRSRDDLNPSSDEVTIQHSGKSVTAVPENVGLCEVIDVGPDVTNVRPGDIAFIDFFDVAQGYLLAGEEVFVTPAYALRMRMRIETEPMISKVTGKPVLHQRTRRPLEQVVACEIHPLPGYVLTKHAPDRMTVAVVGHDRQILPRHMTTSGIVGGRSSDGDPCTFVVYEEVVEVAPGDIQCEREDSYTERKLRAQIQRLEAIIGGSAARPVDVAPGDLVCFCTEFAIQFRALGEQFRCLPYRNLLAVVDDRAILADYNATNPPPPLVRVIGGGAKLLYGT